MNEPLMHATIALAARCAERDTPPTARSVRLLAQELVTACGLHGRDCDALFEAANSFAARDEAPFDSLDSREDLVTYSTAGQRRPSDTRTGIVDTAPETRPAEIAPNTRWGDNGRYEIVRRLGRGGMGSVYAATDTVLQRTVALKVLEVKDAEAAAYNMRFLREIRLAARVEHERIARVYDGGVCDGYAFFAMEYIAGTTLRRWMTGHELSIDHVVDVATQIAEGLAALHGTGVVHRDLKPENVMLTAHGEVKLLDFGLAQSAMARPTSSDTSPHAVVRGGMIVSGFSGTPGYMAPEQCAGRPSDARVDVFALGVILYELVTGERPFRGESAKALIDATLSWVPGLHDGWQRFPKLLRHLCVQMLARDPEERFADGIRVLAALRELAVDTRLRPVRLPRTDRAGRTTGDGFELAGARQRDIVTPRMLTVSSMHLRELSMAPPAEAAGLPGGSAPDIDLWATARAWWRTRKRRWPVLLAFAMLITFAIGVPAFIVTVSRRASQSEQLLARSYEESGRRLMLDERPQEAMAYLLAARRNGQDGPALRWLFATASRGLPVTAPLEHRATVVSAAFSSDGTRIVTASADHTAQVWRATDGKRLGAPLLHQGVLWSAAFSPDGTRVVTASGDHTARVWDATTGRALTVPLRHEDAVLAAAFSPDGARVVTASADHTARIWDGSTGQALCGPLEHDAAVLSAAFSPDGTRVVTASADHTAQIWDAATGQPVGSPLRHHGAVNRAVFSPDGALVATASADDTARIWNAATGRPVTEPLEHHDGVSIAAFSPDGALVVTASADKTARIWNVATGHLVTEPLEHADRINTAAFSPDGTLVVTASADKTARVWDAVTGTPLGTPLEHQGEVESAAFSLDGTRVVTASADRSARIWATPDTDRRLVHSTAIRSATFSPDGTHLVTVDADHDARIYWDLWNRATSSPDPATDDPRRRAAGPGSGKSLPSSMKLPGHVVSAAFSADGSRLVTTSDDDAARIWSVGTGQELGEPLRHHGPVNSAVFSLDGRRVVTASDHFAQVWDIVSGRPLAVPLQHDGDVNSAAFSADGGRVVTASADDTARIWDAITAQPLIDPLRHHDAVTSAVFSPDGARVMTVSADDTARIWDARTGLPLTAPLEHRGAITSAAFSPDGTRIITASADHTARIWDARTGLPLTAPLEHRGAITSAAFSPDGTWVVTASADHTARIWDAASGNPLSTPFQHGGTVNSAAFGPDGMTIVTASADHIARLWDTRLDRRTLDEWSAAAERNPFVLQDGFPVLRPMLR